MSQIRVYGSLATTLQPTSGTLPLELPDLPKCKPAICLVGMKRVSKSL